MGCSAIGWMDLYADVGLGNDFFRWSEHIFIPLSSSYAVLSAVLLNHIVTFISEASYDLHRSFMKGVGCWS
jgi:hypothetical protein